MHLHEALKPRPDGPGNELDPELVQLLTRMFARLANEKKLRRLTMDGMDLIAEHPALMETIATLPELEDIQFFLLPPKAVTGFALKLKSRPHRFTLSQMQFCGEDSSIADILNYMAPSSTPVADEETHNANSPATEVVQHGVLASLSSLKFLYVSLLIYPPSAPPLVGCLQFCSVDELALVDGFVRMDSVFHAFPKVRRLTLRFPEDTNYHDESGPTPRRDLDHLNISVSSFALWQTKSLVSWLELDLQDCKLTPHIPWQEMSPVALTVHYKILKGHNRDFWRELVTVIPHTVRSFELILAMDMMPWDTGHASHTSDVFFLLDLVRIVLEELAHASLPLVYLRVYCVILDEHIDHDTTIDPLRLIPWEVKEHLPGLQYLSLGVGEWINHHLTPFLPTNDPKWRYSWWRFSEDDEEGRYMPVAVGERLRKEMFMRGCDFKSLAMREVQLSKNIGDTDWLQL
ncbi:hypothetical protein SCP_1600090 [Sparassis crispa]|uniref:Uncharacterized protein n=1 Tax=Sparassis crispa TaxID=139825 RepID=A0A401H4J0_9APHY|nr:hypothetical protein SCP_1600090 [Sparassis crispa]GBE89348.1 hypothetical protein SCP_1600090 [Sparassis crispa]